ncbi:ROK family transcriptional regulator [Streptomyces niveiscabiei]|uniref:ROK family transcriptional regulator n=1 Tax=Streptomyces niveiscabiei TaxID=164115 RepID=UPI0029BD8AA0|nr:ROK family transcriptional regulator [Streptomyces niveiscabiei]MDX3381733.1 ROK family transcriptional regulator [Streptomyces niveiscabiei]
MPASPSTARAINDRLALRLLQREGPLTAGQLKQLTGLSRPTVADLAERLTAAGLIEVVGETGAHRRGPNAKLYGIVASRASLAALDVRTDGVAVIVSDLVGRVLAEAAVPIAGDLAADLALDQAVSLVERAAKEAGADTLHTVCIGAPGLIEPATGDLRDSNGLPTWHRRLVAVLQERFPSARVLVENETNLAALAERGEGAAQDRDTFVLLWLGQGVGAAVVLDGTLRRGASGGTGEIGFLPVPGVGLPSATDCEGGFHSVAGGWAVERLAREFGVPGEGAAEVVRGAADAVTRAEARADDAGTASGGGAGTPAENTAGGETADGTGTAGAGDAGSGSTALPTPTAAVELRAGVPVEEAAAVPPLPDPPAALFLDALADRLALGVASVVAVLDPGCVVLGGEVGQAGGDPLAGKVEARIRRMAPLATEVRASALGGGAVLRGALLTAREAAQDELFGAS